MKKIKFTCSNCGAKLRVPTHLAGISAPCPKCGRKITAPTDLDSVVDDDVPASPGSRPPSDAAPRAIPSPPSSSNPPERPTSVPAPAPASAPPAPSIAPTPAAPPAVTASVSAVMQAPMEDRNSSEPSPPVVQPSPPVVESPPPISEPEPEPIIEETILTPPAKEAPAPEAAPQVGETAIPRPPLEKTEPIQVRPLPGTLPGVREETADSGGTLPRLDAERGLENPTGLDALISPSVTSGAPTKLHLPEAADLTGEQSPGDFIVPAEPTPGPPPVAPPSGNVVPEPETGLPPEPVIPDLSDLDMSAPGTPMEELGEPWDDGNEGPEEPAVSYETPEPEIGTGEQILPEGPSAGATPSLADFEVPLEQGEPQPPSPVSPEAHVPTRIEESPDFEPPADRPASESSMIDLDYDESHSGGLSRGSMENLLFEQQKEAGQTAPILPPGHAGSVAPDDDIDSLFEAPPGPPEAPASRESQSLEEMFGEVPDEAGKKKLTNVVMLSMIGAVAIIAIVVVVLGINAAGGLKPQITSNQTNITPPPRISEIPPTDIIETPAAPETAEAPATIDPVAQERAAQNAEGIARSTTTLPGDTSRPVVIADDAPPSRIETPDGETTSAQSAVPEAPALSFDERVQQIVNGSNDSGGQMNIIGGEASTSSTAPGPLDSLDETIANFERGANDVVDEAVSAVEGAVNGSASPAASNYNPPAAFAAPGPDDGPLGQTRDLLDAFLRAPDWQSRIPYTYQGESLRPTIEDYYKKWPMTSFERYSLTLFQVEQDTSLGGPYWVYLVSLNDLDQGYPVIIRVEDGKLKVDWEIYSEFQDQHFVEFRKGAIASPHSFRLVLERVSDYFGSDRDSFTNLDDYLVYQINPPYGDLSEFSEYAFVKKGTDLAQELDAVVGLNDEPLAVIVTIEQKTFPHGEKHIEITDYVTEGWFR